MINSTTHSVREKPSLSSFKKGDVLVLFGELFNRGYANGLVEEAEKIGMTIVYSTVGRRTKEGTLRPLEGEEIPKDKLFINIPLEAGFDMEPAQNGVTPVEQLKDIKLSDWESAKLDFNALNESRAQGEIRFKKQVQDYIFELEKVISPQSNVLFAHLMAGGVPRAKIVMPLMNRAFKGIGERHLSSEKFWLSDIGKFCEMSFAEVTANTFEHLISATENFRKNRHSRNINVSYLAYGYHGTEILINDTLTWQTYTPYLQGWAKKKLEDISIKYFEKNVSTCVYNCPEILTNSSSIFQGVEVSLYPLVKSLILNCSDKTKVEKVILDCNHLLKEGNTISNVLDITEKYFNDPEIKRHCDFSKWPQHSTPLQLNTMIKASEDLISLHKDDKNIMTSILSEVVFKSCGFVMLHNSFKPSRPVEWLNHDIVSKCY